MFIIECGGLLQNCLFGQYFLIAKFKYNIHMILIIVMIYIIYLFAENIFVTPGHNPGGYNSKND